MAKFFGVCLLFLVFCWVVQSTMVPQPGAMLGDLSEEEMDMKMEDIDDDDDESGCNGTAIYQVVADFVWTAVTHPTDYPAGSAHWSPFAGTTHNKEYRMWGPDMLASPGVQSVAETGATRLLRGEIEACGDDCTSMFSYPCDVFSGTCVSSGTIEVTVERPRFSAVTMIAPSPDWFVGVHDLELCKFGEWVTFYTQDFIAYDSGTDSGVTYRSPNSVTTPPEQIFFITDEDSVLYNPTEMDILPFGNFTITLVDVQM